MRVRWPSLTVVAVVTAVAAGGCSSASTTHSPTAQSSLPSASPSAADGAEWTYVALGDSIVGEGYPQALADLIEQETGRSVAVTSFADGAATSASLLASLRTPGSLHDAVAGADIITITVGGNDADPFATYPPDMCAPGGDGSTCLVRYNSDLEVNYDAILTEIETLREGRPTLIRPTSPDFNPFIGWDAAPSPDFGLSFYRQVAEAETELICSLATTHGMVCADFYHAFNGADGTEDAASLLAADHGHPSAAGSQLIAQIIFEGGLPPLQ